MNPTLIDEMSWRMAEVYEAVTDRILINLAKYFPYIKMGKEPRDLFAYQARMLAQVGKINAETVQIIADSLGGADEALKTVLVEAIEDALKDVDKPLRQAAEKGLTYGAGLVPPVMAPNQMNAFRMFYQQSADKLNLVNTVMLESTEAAYLSTVSDITNRISVTQGILNKATGEVVTGVSSLNEVITSAVQKMVENGLTGFIDHGGHHWSPEAYVAMDVRTTLFNTARESVWEESNAYGVDLYQVSYHDGARPLCYPWQGKVIARAGPHGSTIDPDGNPVEVYAQSETSYGEPAGLFGMQFMPN